MAARGPVIFFDCPRKRLLSVDNSDLLCEWEWRFVTVKHSHQPPEIAIVFGGGMFWNQWLRNWLSCWFLMSYKSEINIQTSNANHDSTEPGKSLGKHPMNLITSPFRGNQMEWKTVLDKLNISPIIWH